MATITQIQYIIKVAELKHFGRAAEECHVSQPSLSAQIQKVEDEIGFTLFDRSKKPIMLTDVGLRFVEQARKVILEHKKLLDIGKVVNEPAGEFKLAIIPTVAPYIMTKFLPEFVQKYKKVDLKIFEMQTSEIVKALSNDSIDGAVLVTPLNNEKIFEKKLYLEPFCILVDSNHELVKKSKVSQKDLKKYPSWLLSEGHCMRSQSLFICGADSNHSVMPQVHFQTGSIESLVGLVENIGGYTLLPILASQMLKYNSKKSKVLEFSSPIPVREVSLVYSRKELKAPIIKGLEEVISQSVKKYLKSEKSTHLVPI